MISIFSAVTTGTLITVFFTLTARWSQAQQICPTRTTAFTSFKAFVRLLSFTQDGQGDRGCNARKCQDKYHICYHVFVPFRKECTHV